MQLTELLSNEVAYNSVYYDVVKLNTPTINTIDGEEYSSLAPCWGVVNIEYKTLESAAYTLYQAISVANDLSDKLSAALKPAAPHLVQ